MDLKLGADLSEIECPHHSRSYISWAKCQFHPVYVARLNHVWKKSL